MLFLPESQALLTLPILRSPGQPLLCKRLTPAAQPPVHTSPHRLSPLKQGPLHHVEEHVCTSRSNAQILAHPALPGHHFLCTRLTPAAQPPVHTSPHRLSPLASYWIQTWTSCPNAQILAHPAFLVQATHSCCSAPGTHLSLQAVTPCIILNTRHAWAPCPRYTHLLTGWHPLYHIGHETCLCNTSCASSPCCA